MQSISTVKGILLSDSGKGAFSVWQPCSWQTRPAVNLLRVVHMAWVDQAGAPDRHIFIPEFSAATIFYAGTGWSMAKLAASTCNTGMHPNSKPQYVRMTLHVPES